MSCIYKIKVKGCLSQKFSRWFNNLEVKQVDNSETILEGKVEDQSALYGILLKIRDMGLPLLYLEEVKKTENPTEKKE